MHALSPVPARQVDLPCDLPKRRSANPEKGAATTFRQVSYFLGIRTGAETSEIGTGHGPATGHLHSTGQHIPAVSKRGSHGRQ